MSNDGVWVKIWPESGDATVPAVIGGESGASVERGKTIDGTVYDVYTFTTPTTRASIILTDAAKERITDEDLLMTVATTEVPDDFAGDPVTLFDEKYRSQLRNALEVTPFADPGLSLTVSESGLVDALIVGGGGGSGNDAGAGAGGLFYQEVTLPAGEQTVTVGSGGVGASSGLPGGYSRLGSFAAPGGGVGQNGSTTNSPGGSSGGGGRAQPSNADGVWQYGYPLYGGAYGNSGSGGTSSPVRGGGGGGAGGPGVTPDGGSGLSININGVNVEYARGGSGLSSTDYGVDIAENTGWGANGSAKSGGSGIVIVRVRV